jgi:CBS-domain-containing membrane protein
MADALTVAQFMVRGVVEAKPWHPVSYARQQMLKHAFSFLPIWHEGKWRLISDASIAKYLRQAAAGRNDRLATPVSVAVSRGDLRLLDATTAASDDLIEVHLQHVGERPILILDPHDQGTLLGLLTASDVL